MIVHKFWSAFMAQINKIANIFWEADPIAQMQYEYDRAVEQLKEGRTGLEQYRGLVERVTRQVAANRSHVAEAGGGNEGVPQGRRPRHRREVRPGAAKGEDGAGGQRAAAPTARDRVRQQPAQDSARQQQVGRAQARRSSKYDAELKMSAAEAEIAKLAESFDMNLTTDFGQIE